MHILITGPVNVLLFYFIYGTSSEDTWEHWWSYEGLSKPSMWGQINNNWHMCRDGKQQSPINIYPDLLLFDPNLKHVKINAPSVNGRLMNTGNDITLHITNDDTHQVNVSEGPLSYLYRITDIKFHFGKQTPRASEHRINNRTFSAEMHLIGYNADVYKSLNESMAGVKGLVIIAIFIEVGDNSNYPFGVITKKLGNVKFRGSETEIKGLSLQELIPKTDQYMTYEGSLTQPGCHESVTWLILNKPIYVSHKQLATFRSEVNMEWISNNVRPVMPLNQRVIRTNINKKNKTKICTIEREFHYKVNDIFSL